VDHCVQGLALSLLLVISLPMMNFKFPLVLRKTCQFELSNLLVGVIRDDNFRSECAVDGLEDMEVALSHDACFFVGGYAKYEFNTFLNLFGSSKGGICAHDFRKISLLLSPSMDVSWHSVVLMGSWFEESAIVG
jgi:hypothetical protein